MTLRDVTMDDSALTLAWRNRPEVRNAMFNTEIVDIVGHTDWLRRTIENPDKTYFIYEEDGKALGIVGLIFTDPPGGLAEWSFHIGEKSAPRGSGTRMLKLALGTFFDQLGGKILYAEVLADNHASRRLHRKLGFVETGLRREKALHLGVEKDVHLFKFDANCWHDLH